MVFNWHPTKLFEARTLLTFWFINIHVYSQKASCNLHIAVFSHQQPINFWVEKALDPMNSL